MTPEASLYLIDMGSTRSRVWLMREGQCLGRAESEFGVRDVARGEPSGHVQQQLIVLMTEAAKRAGVGTLPGFGVAAGMITSAHGLMEVPRVPAPAGLTDLALNMQSCPCGDVRLFLVPGVKTAPRSSSIDGVLASDVMRGEEALSIGLLAHDGMRGPGCILHLGSHWKWISIDAEGRIAGSRTSLTGEMIHAVQSQTLLASGLPQTRPESLDAEWLALGGAEHSRSGLSRALFCVRLLELERKGTAAQRLAFLYGAFLESEMQSRWAADPAQMGEVRIVGPAPLAEAWRDRLLRANIRVSVVSEAQREEAYLHGLITIFEAAQRLGAVAF
jgi:2-dehydro-3-deoxygalactonokinase